MNIEQVGIGLLCVSQACMWWRNAVMTRRAVIGNAKAIKLLDCAREAACAVETNTMYLREHHAPNRADFGALRDEIRTALERMPKKRNLRKLKTTEPKTPEALGAQVFNTTIAPASAGGIGKVSS